MSKNNVVQGSEDGRRDEPSLDSRYGEIGISAVAAALQFESKAAKNPSYASVIPKLDNWRADEAA
jgi:hypothetical protein